MIPVTPQGTLEGARLVHFGAQQPEYHTLPALVDRNGVVMAEFELDASELDRVCRGGRVRLWVYTFGRPLQPVAVEIAELAHADA